MLTERGDVLELISSSLSSYMNVDQDTGVSFRLRIYNSSFIHVYMQVFTFSIQIHTYLIFSSFSFCECVSTFLYANFKSHVLTFILSTSCLRESV